MTRETAYLDAIEVKTGKTLNQFVALAKERGYMRPDTKPKIIMDWLKQEFGLGYGHSMALMHAIKNSDIPDEHHNK